MKNMKIASCLCVFLLGFLATAAGKSQAQDITSISESQELSDLMGKLSDIAQDGASLEFFGFSEDFSLEPDSKNCKLSTAQQTQVSFVDIIQMVLIEAEKPLEYDKALEDFKKMIGKGKYTLCSFYARFPYSLRKTTYFIAKDASYRVLFELAYED